MIFGLVVSSLGLFQMSHFNLEVDFRTAMMARIVQSLGLAFLFVPINITAFAFVPKEKTNYATGLINLARNIGGSSGIAIVDHDAGAPRPVPPAESGDPPDAARPGVSIRPAGIDPGVDTKGIRLRTALNQAQGTLYGMLERQANMQAFVDMFWLLGVIFWPWCRWFS